MNPLKLTFTANEQTLTKTDNFTDFASNTVSYIEATFTLGENWTGYDSVRAVWKTDYYTISTVLDANFTCVVPTEVLRYKAKVFVNLVGSIVENDTLTDRLTTFPVLALTVKANAAVNGSETAPVTPSQFEQFVDTVRDEAESISDYSYDSEAWAVGKRGGVDVPSTDPTYHNNSKYWAQENAGLADDVADLEDDVADLKSDLYPTVLELGSIKFSHVKTVSPNGSYRWATTRIIPEGATVKFKNNATASLSLNVQKADATEQNISTGVAANGGIVTFVAPFDIFYMRSWVGNTSDYDVEVEYGFDNSVSMTMFKNMAAFDVKNIFTLKGASEGSFIDKKGNVGTNQYVGHTDYIDISSYWGEIVLSLLADPDNHVNIYQGAFFDKNKNYISGYQVTGVTSDIDYSINIPNGAQFIIFDYLLNRAPDYYIKATTKNSKAFSMYADSIFTLDGATDGAYADSTTGEIIATSIASVTDYINVSLASKIITVKYDQVGHQGAFYDINKNYVSGYYRQWNDPQGAFEISVPNDAYYVRFGYITSHASDYYAFAIIRERKDIANQILTYAEAKLSTKRFSEMKMNCLGDSITYGYIPDNGAQMSNPYPKLIKAILGLAECRNYGISGSTLAVNSGNYDPMCTRYTNMDNDADIVLVFGGTNDYGRAVYTPTLGTITDNVNTTVYGALNILCEGLITKYPKAFIFLCTPLKRADKTAANGGGYTLEDVADAIRAVGLKFGMPVLDLNAKGGFYISNATFRAQYGGNDKLHPNQAFDNEHLAPMIAKFIESNM